MQYIPGENRDQGELVDSQGPSSSSSGVVDINEQEIMQISALRGS